MPLWKQRLLARYMAPQTGEGGEGGSGEGGEGAGAGEGAGKGQGSQEGGEGGEGGEGDEGKGDGKGKTKPTDAEAKLLKENMQKKADLKKANDELAAAKTRLAEFDGLDAGELKKLVADKKAAEDNALVAKGEWDKLKQRMAEEHTNVVKAKDTELGSLREQNATLLSQINELTIGAAFNSSRYIAEDTVYTQSKARKVFGEHFDLVDGQVVGFDKPRGASGRTALVDQYGNNVAFDVAMAKIVEMDPDKDHILKSKVRQGAGSSSNPNPAQRKAEVPTDGLSKITAGLASLKVTS